MSHARRVQKVERQSEKRAIEVARYVLPVAAFTTMVHTISGVVLYRLWRMQAANDTPTEARHVLGEMVARVRETDRSFSTASTTARWRTGRMAAATARR